MVNFIEVNIIFIYQINYLALVKSNFKINIMKKLITIMCIAAAPVLFAQAKSMKSEANSQTVKTEQEAKKQNHAAKVEKQKKAEAEKNAIKQNEVKAVDNRNSSTKASAVNSKKK